MKKLLSLLLAMALLTTGMVFPAAAEGADADVVVVGAGGGGLSAALEAVKQGAQKVIVLEMTAKTGGALNYTSGSMSAAGTIIQKEDGIEDTVDSYVADIINNGDDFGGKPNEELIRVYANEAAQTFDWLYENGLKNCKFSTDRQTGARAVFAPEHALYSVQRTYKASPKDPANYKSAAHEVLDTLVKADDRIEVKLNTKAVKLVANDQGQVLTVETEDGTRYTAEKAVIMATGGYSANGKLMAKYVPYGEDYLAGGAAGANGYGLRMMQEVGAGLTAMDAIPTFPMGLVSKDNPKTGSIASTYTWKTGGIVVNQNGERFCNETESNPAIREVALEEQPGAVQYDIFTDKIVEDLRAANGAYFYDAFFADETMRGYHVVESAATLEELAAKIGVPAENLTKTVETYNAAVEAGESDEFGRLYDGTVNTYNLGTNKIEGDKFYAVRLHALCVMTLGGVTANANMQVLDEAGNAIPGLYAAGETVGGIWGKFVSGGTGVMGPIVFGQIAARHAMANEPAEGYTVKAAANLLDESLFVKESAEGELFDMTRALTDGEYTATVDGQEGPMTVKTTIEGGKIAKVEVTENHETQAIAGGALESIPAKIVETNNPTVDAVAGATLTSGRIMKAVAECLNAAAK
ncbi:MAG: FAD-dependent oxidoreductase [Christensenellales bacterium]|nr:FAD-dependent oxidoreductase [Christensenellales bacterium]